LEGLVGDSSIVSDVFPKSNNYLSVGTGEGLGDDYSRGLLFLVFYSSEGLLSLGTFSNSIEVVSPRFVVSSVPECIPFIGDRCIEGDGRGWYWWGGRVSSFGVGSGWFVGMGVSRLWVQFVNFGSRLGNLLLKLGDPVGTGILGGSKCSLHVVEAGKNLVHEVGIGLIEEHRVESVLGKGSIDVFALSWYGSKARTISAYAYPLYVCCLCLLIHLCPLVPMYIYHLLMYICLCLLFLIFAYATYVCLCLLIYLLMGYDISKGLFCWTTKKGKYLVEFSAMSEEEDLCI
jgi:hypothetical protein